MNISSLDFQLFYKTQACLLNILQLLMAFCSDKTNKVHDVLRAEDIRPATRGLRSNQSFIFFVSNFVFIANNMSIISSFQNTMSNGECYDHKNYIIDFIFLK